jgi:hypothetical protein
MAALTQLQLLTYALKRMKVNFIMFLGKDNENI